MDLAANIAEGERVKEITLSRMTAAPSAILHPLFYSRSHVRVFVFSSCSAWIWNILSRVLCQPFMLFWDRLPNREVNISLTDM